MPQARSSGSKSSSSSSSKAKSAKAPAKRATAASSRGTAAKRSSAASSRGTASKGSGAGSTSPRASASSKPKGSDARLEAAATRLRKLNERIIDAGKEAGEATLSSYEKALRAIAASIERGPGSSDIDWISHLATTQAKFIRDVTNAWTAAARDVLK